MDLVGKAREEVFHILYSVLMLVGWREGNGHLKISNSVLNCLPISQSLSLSPSPCTFYLALLNNQNKEGFVHRHCPGPSLALCWLEVVFPAHWTWFTLITWFAPWNSLRVFTWIYFSGCAHSCLLWSGDAAPTLWGPKPWQQLVHSWWGTAGLDI